MEPKIDIMLAGCTGKNGERSIRLTATNVGEVAIQELAFHFEYKFDTPQPPVSDKPVIGKLVGKGIEFGSDDEQEGAVQPGESRVYWFPPFFMDDLKSLIQSLSPDRYHLKLTMDDVVQIVQGNQLGALLEKAFQTISGK